MTNRPSILLTGGAGYIGSHTDDGLGSWRDNVFVERLWRSIKYEEVYLHAYESVSHAKAGIARYIGFYNARRPHSSLDKQTPDEFYFDTLPAKATAT